MTREGSVGEVTLDGKVAMGGQPVMGGSFPMGGVTATGGTTTTGGRYATGGLTAGGGGALTGGMTATGGLIMPGGGLSMGGANASGGNILTGGISRLGGVGTTGGLPATGGTSQVGGTTVSDAGPEVGSSTGGVDTGGANNAMGGASGTGGTTGGTSICPTGIVFPSPDLTGKATLVYQAPVNGTSGQFEGAVWLADRSMLLYSDMATGSTAPIVPAQIMRLVPPNSVQVAIPDSGSNGLAVDSKGTVYACSHKVQGIVKVDVGAGTLTVIVDNIGGKKFNSPNDLVVRSDGTIYFTDPDFQLGSGRVSETGVKGVYRVSPAGQVTLIDGTFTQPNGVGLSPDETTLYVADYSQNTIFTFALAADGTPSGKKTFASVTGPDGMAVDCAGNVYFASNSAGVAQVFSRAGTKLGSVTVAPGMTNLAFGGPERKTIYFTVGRSIYSLPMNLPGLPD